MKKISIYLTLGLFLSLASFSVSAVDTTIRILGVLLPGSNSAKAQQQLATIPTHWHTNYSNGITVTLANGGVPVVLNSALISGDVLTQWNNANLAAQTADIRNQHGADVLIFFAQDLGFSPTGGRVCGFAPQGNWTNAAQTKIGFIGTGPDQLDLNGRNQWFSAIIDSTDLGCNGVDDNTYHEFGHLFGAGHEVSVNAPPGHYLYNDSHASELVLYWGISWRSVLYSNPLAGVTVFGFSGAGSTNNVKAIRTTAKSVANYRTALESVGGGIPSYPSPPSSCMFTEPLAVNSSLQGTCDPLPWSRYVINWTDACPAEHTLYEVWFSQPDGGAYEYGWSTNTTSDDAYVTGDDARVKIKACNTVGCSFLSPTDTLVIPQC